MGSLRDGLVRIISKDDLESTLIVKESCIISHSLVVEWIMEIESSLFQLCRSMKYDAGRQTGLDDGIPAGINED